MDSPPEIRPLGLDSPRANRGRRPFRLLADCRISPCRVSTTSRLLHLTTPGGVTTILWLAAVLRRAMMLALERIADRFGE